jgi:hypothetical protein
VLSFVVFSKLKGWERNTRMAQRREDEDIRHIKEKEGEG